MKMKILADFEIYISAPLNFVPKLIRNIYGMGAMQFYRFVCMIVAQAHISLMTRLVVMPPRGFMAALVMTRQQSSRKLQGFSALKSLTFD